MRKVTGFEKERLLTFENFYGCVLKETITNNDGIGYFSDGEVLYAAILCDTRWLMKQKERNPHYTHVVWFNN